MPVKNFPMIMSYGSLGVFYGNSKGEFPFPFMIHIDKENPIHVFDSHNLPIIFSELGHLL